MSKTVWLLAKDDRELAQARLSFKVAYELQAVQPDKPRLEKVRLGVMVMRKVREAKLNRFKILSVDLIEFHSFL